MVTAAELKGLLSYDAETGLFTWVANRRGGTKAGDAAGYVSADGYRNISIRGKGYAAHRLAWLHERGEWPNQQVDHINGNRDDNRIANLRDVSPSTNCQNQRKAHSSNKACGLMGVSYGSPNRWKAKIVVAGRDHHLGYFKTPDQAHAAYLGAKRSMHEGNTI